MSVVYSLLWSVLNVETLNDFHDGETIAFFEMTHANIDYAMMTVGRNNETIIIDPTNGIYFGLINVEIKIKLLFEGVKFETSGAENGILCIVRIDDPVFVCNNEAFDVVWAFSIVDDVFEQEL